MLYLVRCSYLVHGDNVMTIFNECGSFCLLIQLFRFSSIVRYQFTKQKWTTYLDSYYSFSSSMLLVANEVLTPNRRANGTNKL